MRHAHRPDLLLVLYLTKLWTANIIVVRVELILEADRKVALGSTQRVRSGWTRIVNARNAINWLATQERIRIRNCLQDARARERTIRKVQLCSQQVTCETTNRIIRFVAAAVHRLKDLSGFRDCIH